LAAVKLESENKQLNRARAILSRAREEAGTVKVWIKSAKLESEIGTIEEERRLLDEALVKYPQVPKLWLMRGAVEEKNLCKY